MDFLWFCILFVFFVVLYTICICQDIPYCKQKMYGIGSFIIASVIITSLGFQIYKAKEQPDNITANVVKTNKTLFVENKKVFKKEGESCVSFELDGKSFILTENEYNKYVGADNDAVDTEIYTLKLSSDYVDTKIMWHNDRSSFVPKVLDSLGVANTYIPDSVKSIYSLELEPFDSYTITYDELTHKLPQYSSKGEIVRYSFLGQSNFTNDEIEEYKNNVKDFNTSFLDSFRKVDSDTSFFGSKGE